MNRQALVLENQGIAIRVLSRLRVSRGLDYEDARAEAMLALVVAASTFDPAHGASFSTWAWLKVSGAVKDWLDRNRRTSFGSASPEQVSSVVDGAQLPDAHAYDRQVERAIAERVRDEPECVREMVEGVVFGGLTTKECAWRSGTTHGTAVRRRKLAREALAGLRDDLELDG